jgi:hypothetical protein
VSSYLTEISKEYEISNENEDLNLGNIENKQKKYYLLK